METIKRVFIYFLLLSLINLSLKAHAFQDVDRESRAAAEELIDSGMFETFVFKYGESYFRPEGSVSRGDMLLVLREYQAVTERLFGQNKRLISKLQELEQREITSSEVDMIIGELFRVLNPVIKELKTDMARLSEEKSPPVRVAEETDPEIIRDLKKLEKDIAALKREADKPEPAAPPRVAHDIYLSPLRLTIGLSAIALFMMAQ